MTDFISRLKELRNNSTPGTWWREGFTVHNSKAIIADCQEQRVDVFDDSQVIETAELIATMRNSLDLWLELAEAVEDNIIAGNHTTERLRLAFANLSGDLFGETETLSTPRESGE